VKQPFASRVTLSILHGLRWRLVSVKVVARGWNCLFGFEMRRFEFGVEAEVVQELFSTCGFLALRDFAMMCSLHA
jgi:hypothetical protein